MKLYEEDARVIFDAQFKDPFFHHLTRRLFSKMEKKGTVLDIGCGSGRNVFYVVRQGHSAVGVDPEQKAIDIANREADRRGVQGRARFICADITKLPEKSIGLFDYCVSTEVIEHIADSQAFVRFAHACLKPGGTLFLTTPNDLVQWNLLDVYAGHVRRFTLDELRDALSPFRSVTLSTIGFPLHRMAIALYTRSLAWRGCSHEPRSFRSNGIVSNLYFLAGSLVMRIDDLFGFTHWGSTILAVAEK